MAIGGNMAINLTIDEIRSGTVRQGNLPCVPPETAQARAQLLADAKLVSKRLQQPCDLGLFGAERDQLTLL